MHTIRRVCGHDARLPKRSFARAVSMAVMEQRRGRRQHEIYAHHWRCSAFRYGGRCSLWCRTKSARYRAGRISQSFPLCTSKTLKEAEGLWLSEQYG